jgi:hypothetical protein
VIVIGSDLVPDDLAANYHRVGGGAANPTYRYISFTRGAGLYTNFLRLNR